MEPDYPSEQYGRGMRQRRKSQRAKQAADQDDAAINQLSRPSNGTIDPSIISRSASTSTRPHRHILTATNMVAGKTPALGNSAFSTANGHSKMLSQADVTLSERVASNIEAQSTELRPAPDVATMVGDCAAASQTRQPSMHPPVEESHYRVPPKDSAQPSPAKQPTKVNKSTKSSNKKGTKHARAVPQHKPKEAPTVKKDIQNFVTDDPQLQAARFHIYQWERPIPTDFLNLPESWKAAKARVDALEGEMDDAPELDDWHDFCGIDNMLLPIPLKMAIGLNFISRAKRAFRAGRSFISVEREERAIDSRAGANAIRDPTERALALSSALRNADRMYVYEQIKVRLCHEIWLEPYPGTYADAVVSAGTNPSFNEAGASGQQNQQFRTQPELPGQFRELHQPQGDQPRMS